MASILLFPPKLFYYEFQRMLADNTTVVEKADAEV